nr:MAG TPA: hypothetical protein [Bacteriophage sp.]
MFDRHASSIGHLFRDPFELLSLGIPYIQYPFPLDDGCSIFTFVQYSVGHV